MKIVVKPIFGITILMELISLSLITSAAPVVIDFEDLSTAGYGIGNQVTVFHQYVEKGITFNSPKAIDYSKAARPDLYQGFAHSGTKVVEQCYSKEFCSTPIQIDFTSPQKRVKVWVGYSDVLRRQKTVILSAFDQTGTQVGQTTAMLQPSTNPIPIQTSIEVISSNANIYIVTIKFAPDSNGLSFSGGLAVDDIEFDAPGDAPPCSSTRAPIVTLDEPPAGQILRHNSFDVRGIVSTTSPIEEALLIITGSSGNSKSLDLFSNGVFSRDGGTFSVIGVTDMLFLGSNTITVKVRDCEGSRESSTTLIFQPCDSTTSPVVTIIEPHPSPYPSPSKTISSDSFQLKGKIDSISELESVTVTVTHWLGSTYGIHKFNINPDGKGAFDMEISSDNLFQTINTITVTAQDNQGCSGHASTTIGYVIKPNDQSPNDGDPENKGPDSGSDSKESCESDPRSCVWEEFSVIPDPETSGSCDCPPVIIDSDPPYIPSTPNTRSECKLDARGCSWWPNTEVIRSGTCRCPETKETEEACENRGCIWYGGVCKCPKS